MRYKHLLGKELKATFNSDTTYPAFISGIDYKIGISLSKLDGEGNLFCMLPKYKLVKDIELYKEYKKAFEIVVKQFIKGYFSQEELISDLGKLLVSTWGYDPTKSCPFK